MKKHLTLSIVFIALAVAIAGMSYVYMQEASEWLVTLTPDQPYIKQPITFKAYSYSSPLQQIYYVTCNLTLINATDVIWFKQASGAPAIYTFELDRAGSYSLKVYCSNEKGEQYTGFFSISVLFPEPNATYTAYWGRPVDITIRLPYKYTGEPIALVYQGMYYSGVLVDGVAEFSNLPAIYKPEDVTVLLFGEARTFTVTPSVPSIVLEVAPNPFVTEASVRTLLVDELGVVPVSHPVKYSVSGGCVIEGAGFVTNAWYTVKSTNPRPLEPSACTISVSTTLWSGVVLTASVDATILPVNVTEATITYTNTTPWNYVLRAVVSLSHLQQGELSLYVDDVVVGTASGYYDRFEVTYAVEFYPGLHKVHAVLKLKESSMTIGPLFLDIPRHPYKIQPPPSTVYAGDKVTLTNAYWHAYTPRNTTLVIVAYYPGDDYYAPAREMFVVRVIYPEITLTEQEIAVRHAAPGSNIKVYCVNGNEKKLIAELYSIAENHSYSLPPADCDWVEAVYTYGSYVQVVRANEPEPVKVLTTVCSAGAPCMLVEPSPKILRVEIGSHVYKPGTSIALPAGHYTMKIYLADGHVLTVPVTVKEQKVEVIAYRIPGTSTWVVDVRGPSYATIKIGLSNGRVIEVGPGTYYLYQEPVSAYWDYGPVNFIKGEKLS